ncbi:MAG: UvrD-helicase domain-containing protein [Oleiphilaceae bacterium]|nr:UvrD-helicase domain-containing protein [Oleiphilaceae bacterium]
MTEPTLQAPQQQAQPLDATTLPLAGRHLIEASAGTGKTFNITRLYLRLLLEQQLPVEKILVMTFTRAATAELRTRLSREIQQAHDQWGQLTGPFFESLQQSLAPQKARALLHQALLCLDEAAVYTIHSFCKRALTQQAFSSGISFSANLEADSSTLMMEALEDWYRTRARRPDFPELYGFYPTPEDFAAHWRMTIHTSDPVPPTSEPDPRPDWQAFRQDWPQEREAFLKLNVNNRRASHTRAAWQSVFGELDELAGQDWPGEIPPVFTDSELRKDGFKGAKKAEALPSLHRLTDTLRALQKARKAAWAREGILYAREHLHRSKDRLDQLDFNDLIRLLRERLQDPEAGPGLARRLVEQFPAALVDEFQDTDPDQYAILQALYQSDSRPEGTSGEPFLCMIGDPKQAIYGFRGGDVFAYLKAREDARYHWVMDTNYRSSGGVISGYNRLFHGAPLDRPAEKVFGFGIDYTPVHTGKTGLPGLTDQARDRSDFQWCLMPAPVDEKGKPANYNKDAQKELADWCAREIRRLLVQSHIADEAGNERPISPGDIAILVRQKQEAQTLQSALAELDLNAVYLSARDNVMDSPEAQSLWQALNGILDLEDDRALIAALATPWLGYDTKALFDLQNDEHAWAQTLSEISALRQRWLNQGFMSMGLRLLQQHTHPDPERHERLLTNSLHLLELLQEASQKHRQPRALLHWFQQAMEEAGSEASQMRLENDANLIQIVTLHGAKGLEYPVVFMPFISYGRQKPKSPPLLVRYHRREDLAPVQALNPDDDQMEWFEQEQIAEEKRLLYVGATRAERRIYLLAAEFKQFDRSPLARCLGVTDFQGMIEQLGAQQEEGHCGLLDVNDSRPALPEGPQAPEPSAPEPAHFKGRIERDWWLSSFSALTRNARQGGLSTPDRDQDEPETATDATAESGEGPESLRFSLPRGAEAGNLLHDLLEWLDFTRPDYRGALSRAADRYPALMTPPDSDAGARKTALQHWLQQILDTPLHSGARLSDLPMEDTLRESAFYFPMASRQRGRLGHILARHRGTDRVNLPEPPSLKGMLHGFVDLIYQWQGRYYVVDYKSTFLGDRLRDYQEPRLTESMEKSYYDLQYLLYSLALHRYLRTRIPDYDPARHLGGVEYLYLRGLSPQTQGGVFHRPADLDALNALDRLFSGQPVSGKEGAV